MQPKTPTFADRQSGARITVPPAVLAASFVLVLSILILVIRSGGAG